MPAAFRAALFKLAHYPFSPRVACAPHSRGPRPRLVAHALAPRVRSRPFDDGTRMARDQVDMTPIETRDELVAWFEAGAKPKEQFRVGTEHEKFTFRIEDHRPVGYEGPRGIRALLEGMQMLLGWEPIMERENIIGLFDVTGGEAISLEPGGQFE